MFPLARQRNGWQAVGVGQSQVVEFMNECRKEGVVFGPRRAISGSNYHYKELRRKDKPGLFPIALLIDPAGFAQ